LAKKLNKTAAQTKLHIVHDAINP